ncbi:MAG: hypothetical protein ACQETE_01670 [Bacteroidota bacterium]
MSSMEITKQNQFSAAGRWLDPKDPATKPRESGWYLVEVKTCEGEVFPDTAYFYNKKGWLNLLDAEIIRYAEISLY